MIKIFHIMNDIIDDKKFSDVKEHFISYRILYYLEY